MAAKPPRLREGRLCNKHLSFGEGGTSEIAKFRLFMIPLVSIWKGMVEFG